MQLEQEDQTGYLYVSNFYVTNLLSTGYITNTFTTTNFESKSESWYRQSVPGWFSIGMAIILFALCIWWTTIIRRNEISHH